MTLQTYLQSKQQDGIIYLSDTYFCNADDPTAKQKALEKTAELLRFIPGDLAQEEYMKAIAKVSGVKIGVIKKTLKAHNKDSAFMSDANDEGLLSRLNQKEKEEFNKFGFYSKLDGERTGYYFPSQGMKTFEQKSNFIIEPMFQNYDMEDNTRVIKINNGIDKYELVELPSEAMLSADQFRKFAYAKGPYLFIGANEHLNKINRRYMRDFPKAFPLKFLGWQNEGFQAFYNYIYSNGKLIQYNEMGVVKHGDQHFFSPASSEIYTGFREEDNQYENDRYVKYVKAPITFSQWCDLMVDVYEDHAYAGIAYAIAALFKDVVFRVDNNFPLLYCYGQSQSGKSKFGESIMALFFVNMPAFQLNAGTDFAFSNRLERTKNAPMLFNEFDDQVVKDEWFQQLKGAYDGEGRERGRGGSKKKTETQKVNVAPMLVGQYLSTKDDNSILSRSIMRVFHKKPTRTEQQGTKYSYLKDLEKSGITSLITDLLEYRADIAENYYTRFSEEMKAMGDKVVALGKNFNERVLRNYTALVTVYVLFRERIDMPWTADEYRAWALGEVIELSGMISTNDILTDFWTTMETLVSEGTIREGEHYKIEEKTRVRVTVDGADSEIDLGETKTVLWVRMKSVQQLYARFKRSMGQGAIDLTSLTSYVKNRSYYLGHVKTEHFTQVKRDRNDPGTEHHQSLKTSADLFLLDGMDLALTKSTTPHPAEPPTAPFDEPEVKGDKDDLPF